MSTPNWLIYANGRTQRTKGVWYWLGTVITDPNLLTVVTICAVGLLLSLLVIFRFPDFAGLIEQYYQF